jgi:ABC-type spermidine/putrescine transport system permease subunit I
LPAIRRSLTQAATIPSGGRPGLGRGPDARPQAGWRATPPAAAGLLLAVPFILVAAALIVYPFLRLVQVAAGPPHGWRNFNDFFTNPADVRTLVITCRDALVVTVVCVGIAVSLAWSLRTTHSALARWASLLGIVTPLWMGGVVKIYAFTVLLERNGVVNRFLELAGLSGHPLQLLYTQFAVIVGMVYQMLPYAVIPVYAIYATIDLDLVRAAEGLGASRGGALRTVVLPLALPGVLAATIIVYVVSLGFFLTPVLLGGATAPFTASIVANDIFTYYNMPEAAVSSVVLLVVGLLTVGAGGAAVGRERLRRALG